MVYDAESDQEPAEEAKYPDEASDGSLTDAKREAQDRYVAEYPDCAANILHSRPDARAESDGCPESKLHDGSNSLDAHDGTASVDWHDGTASLDQHDGTAAFDSKLQDGRLRTRKQQGKEPSKPRD